jgi:hypothetical protein
VWLSFLPSNPNPSIPKPTRPAHSRSYPVNGSVPEPDEFDVEFADTNSACPATGEVPGEREAEAPLTAAELGVVHDFAPLEPIDVQGLVVHDFMPDVIAVHGVGVHDLLPDVDEQGGGDFGEVVPQLDPVQVEGGGVVEDVVQPV